MKSKGDNKVKGLFVTSVVIVGLLVVLSLYPSFTPFKSGGLCSSDDDFNKYLQMYEWGDIDISGFTPCVESYSSSKQSVSSIFGTPLGLGEPMCTVCDQTALKSFDADFNCLLKTDELKASLVWLQTQPSTTARYNCLTCIATNYNSGVGLGCSPVTPKCFTNTDCGSPSDSTNILCEGNNLRTVVFRYIPTCTNPGTSNTVCVTPLANTVSDNSQVCTYGCDSTKNSCKTVVLCPNGQITDSQPQNCFTSDSCLGSQSRTCTNNVWSSWSTCVSSLKKCYDGSCQANCPTAPVCSNSDTVQQDCSNSQGCDGLQSKQCMNGQWGYWGNCISSLTKCGDGKCKLSCATTSTTPPSTQYVMVTTTVPTCGGTQTRCPDGSCQQGDLLNPCIGQGFTTTTVIPTVPPTTLVSCSPIPITQLCNGMSLTESNMCPMRVDPNGCTVWRCDLCTQPTTTTTIPQPPVDNQTAQLLFAIFIVIIIVVFVRYTIVNHNH